MKKHAIVTLLGVVVSGICSLVGVALPAAHAQPIGAAASTDPDGPPLFWSWFRPLGEARDDPRFQYTLSFSLIDGIDQPIATYGQNWGINGMTGRQPEVAGLRVAQELEARRRDPARMGLIIRALGGINIDGSTIVYPNEANFGVAPRLYDKRSGPSGPGDELMVNGQPWRMIWMRNGIRETKAWSETFLRTMAQNTQHPPGRIFFDQEILLIGYDEFWGFTELVGPYAQTTASVVDFWNAVKADPRFDDSNFPVPGCNGLTLKQVWEQAGVGDPLPPGPGQIAWIYLGRSQKLHEWFSWWFTLCEVAYGGALNEAFFSEAARFFPNALVGDYFNTQTVDGQIGEYGRPANAIMAGAYYGSSGPTGMRFWYRSEGTNLMQMPNFYGLVGAYHWRDYAAGNVWNRPRWSNTDDDASPVFALAPNGFQAPRGMRAGDEHWSDAGHRLDRFRLDAHVRSANPAPVIPWIPMPGMLYTFAGSGTYDGLSYASYKVPTRVSYFSALRTLQLLRSRGIREAFIWSERGGDNVYFQPGPHTNFAQNWNMFKRGVDTVWGFRTTGVGAGQGGITLAPSVSSEQINVVRTANASYAEPNAGKLIATSSSGKPVSVYFVNQWRNMSVPLPFSLNFDIELSSSLATKVRVFVREATGTNPKWLPIGDLSAGNMLADPDGRNFPVSIVANKTVRFRTRVLNSPNLVNPTTGEILFLIQLDGVEGQPLEGKFDLVSLWGSDQRLRPMGDFDGDYSVSNADDQMFVSLANQMISLGENAPSRVKATKFWLDIDRNDVITQNDIDLWRTQFFDVNRRWLGADDSRFSTVDPGLPR